MNDEIQITKKGINFTWELIFRIALGILIPLVAGHMWLTLQQFAHVSKSQAVQDQRMERIERAIVDCLAEKQKHQNKK